MIRTLLATTALAALLSTGVMAQDAAPAVDPAAPTTTEAPATNDAMAPATNDAMAPATNDAMAPAAGTAMDSTATPMAPFDMLAGYTAVDTDSLATRLIDQAVYSSTGDDAEEIGNVSDLVFNEDGQITAVIIGVGGFLGIGEKSVAVDFHSLEFTVATDNTERWVLPTTADALNQAPDFVWKEDKPADNTTGTDAMAPADTTMAPADTTAAPAPATN
ncbi:MAG: PRC-barrel domain-containing protein [Devosia sp.]